ncbi:MULTISPECIES: ATP synthase subunit I [Paenibacillus]|uniref:ATP synthase subunit I n=1 Tax=Paenibacillus radicis (ex Xue et al. 2023) TaxID=2972489 RepID=A0ABT1YGL3_9BACL|nr:ATP synthase subunit I [Paenibacillus radicis (ex Xue et al. 2023)]MCR8632316.1 ATP synthase subunit I [Paenibacillus radicis (ex Xue et al. 2023)]
MDDFSAHLKTVQNVFLFFLSFCLVSWAIFEDFRPYSAGLMLGSIASMINARYLAWKILRLSEKVIKASLEQQVPRKATIGFLTRAAIAGLAGLIAVRYPEHIALPTTIAGYFFAQLATLVLGILSIKRSKK